MEFQIILSKKQPWHITADKKSTFLNFLHRFPISTTGKKVVKNFNANLCMKQ